MLRSIYHQNKHNFFFPGRLNFNEHVNSNHITEFLCLKKLTIYVCGKKKVMDNNDRMKMKVRDEMSISYLVFWLINANPSTLPVGSTRVIYSPVSTAYRTHELKYPKVYLSLKTFKSLIEHS